MRLGLNNQTHEMPGLWVFFIPRNGIIMASLQEYPQLKILQKIVCDKKIPLYLVGGFLRDYLLQCSPKIHFPAARIDFDFTLPKNALKIGKLFAQKIKGAYVILDRERGCARIVKKHGKHIYTFDFSDFRVRTLQGDLIHRDFTMNTLCLNFKDFDLSDEISSGIKDFKGGIRDIYLKKIRMVSPKAFREDPLRILRAFSLRAILNFKIERKTLAQMRKDQEFIKNVSMERIREELFKILDTERAAVILKEIDKIALLEKIIPHVGMMYNCPQGGYHHLDVWEHSLETVVQLDKVLNEVKERPELSDYLNEPVGSAHSRRSILKLAALLHDIGKPKTKKIEKERTSFHGHEHVGKSIARSIAKILKLSTSERFVLEDMVLWHLRPGYLSNFKTPSERSFYRYFRDTKEEGVSIALLSLADQRATRGSLTTQKDQERHEKICLNLVQRYFEKKKEKPFIRLINGHDLIKELKLKPSPLFGKIFKEVEEKQNLGMIQSKKEALELAKEVVKK